MPEGHTIHRAALDQRPMLLAQALAITSPQGRFSEGASLLDGQTCTAVEAYGKHLIYSFAHGYALHIHLGLFGRFRMGRNPVAEPRGEVRVRLAGLHDTIDINGPNTCEILDGAALSALVARIGPDVLRADAKPERAWDRISKSRSAIGQLLMDQSVISGIGNIYRSEILWRQKVHPQTPGKDIDHATFTRLWDDAVNLLQIGVRHNAIITVDVGAKSVSRYGERVNIFGKDSCPACRSPIHISELAGRRVFSCISCQSYA